MHLKSLVYNNKYALKETDTYIYSVFGRECPLFVFTLLSGNAKVFELAQEISLCGGHHDGDMEYLFQQQVILT